MSTQLKSILSELKRREPARKPASTSRSDNKDQDLPLSPYEEGVETAREAIKEQEGKLKKIKK
jgi:hypothetical protein